MFAFNDPFNYTVENRSMPRTVYIKINRRRSPPTLAIDGSVMKKVSKII